MDEQPKGFETELSANDRRIIEEADYLADLTRHPAWPIYVEKCLEPFIEEVQNLILNGLPRRNGERPLSAVEEQGIMHGARYILKTLIVVRNKPQELLSSARRFREEFLPQPEESHAAQG